MMREQLQKWLETAKIWYNNRTSLQSALPEDDQLSDFVQFLRNLSEALGSALRVQHAIESFPETGQLLGRLNALPCLLAISDVYKYYLRCLLALYTEAPEGDIETKASSWAMSQIRYSMINVKSHDGIMQIRNSVVDSLCSKHSNQITVSNTASDCLLGTCQLCLKLSHLPECASVLNELMNELIHLKSSSELTTFLQKASQVKLLYKSQVALYKMHLPALERDVHSAVVSALMEFDQKNFLQEMNRYNLIRAAAENPCIFIAIEYWLKGMCVKSDMHYKWAFISVWYLDATSRHQPNLVSIKPPIFPISGSSRPCIETHVKSIGRLLEAEPSIHSTHPAFFTILHHSAIFLSLISTDETRKSCIKILLFRYSNFDYKSMEQMQDFVAGLGCLLLKSHVETTALQCCWGQIFSSEESNQAAAMCRIIARQLLLVFLILTPVRQEVAESILQKATDSSNARDWLEALLDTVLIADSLNAPWIRLQRNHVLSLVQFLWDRVKKQLPSVTCLTDGVHNEQPILADSKYEDLESSIQTVRKKLQCGLGS